MHVQQSARTTPVEWQTSSRAGTGHRVCSGELPAGANGLRGNYRPNRARDPLALRLFLLLYLCSGMALLVWGLLVLVGMAPALRLR